MIKRTKLPATPGSKFQSSQPDALGESTGQQGLIRRIPANNQTQGAAHGQLKPKSHRKSAANLSRTSSTSRRLKAPKSERSNISEHSATQGVLMASKNVASRPKHRPPHLQDDNKRSALDDSCNMEEGNARAREPKRPRPTQQGLNSNTNSSMSAAEQEHLRSNDPYAIEREAAKSARELPAKQAYDYEMPRKAAQRRNTQHGKAKQQPNGQANGYRGVETQPLEVDGHCRDGDRDISYDHSGDHSNVLLTGSNDDSGQNMYHNENQKIEYVNKQYSGYGWCCSSGEMTEIHPETQPKQQDRHADGHERQQSVKDRIADFFGWQTTDQHNTTINEEFNEDETSQSQIGTSGKPTLPGAERNAATTNDITQPTVNTSPSTNTLTTEMPHKMRQQLGLTPKTNMRLFKCDNQPQKKSMLSNASIAPCSEESFVRDDLPRQQKPSDYRSQQQPPRVLRGDLRQSYNSSTHSYDYHSSLGGESNPPGSSIVDNLHALSINIQRREKELDMQAAKKGRSQTEMKAKEKPRAVRRQETELTASNGSQIPEESESGGPIQNQTQPKQIGSVQQKQQKNHDQDPSQTPKAIKQVSINFESVIMLENKLNRITNGLAKIKFAEDQAMMAYNNERQSQQAIENYRVQHEELIGLCEEYWSILRAESFLFCQLPQRMFKENPRLVHEIKRAFVLKLVVVSEIGFLISNDDFMFADSFLKESMSHVCKSFLTFMRIILSKLTTAMLANFFWARKLEEIVTQKMKVDNSDDNFRMNILRNSPNPSALSGQSAVDKLKKVNNQTDIVIRTMFDEVERMRVNSTDGREVEKYDHKLFSAITNILTQMDKLSFKEVSTLIGQSLVGDFSELDATETSKSGSEARKSEGAFPNPDIKAPFLPKLKGPKRYTLVLDLDETLVHYNEDQNAVLVRPFAVKFLQQMAQYYEVVIFTAGTKDYADWALEHLANKAARHYIDYRLYRDHTIQCMEVFIKDLSYLGRELDRTIIVDNITENFLLQPDNGITIKSWFDDPDDTALMDLAPLLRQIVEQRVPDVRIALKESKEQLLEAIASGEINPVQRLRQLSFSDRSDQQLSFRNEVAGQQASDKELQEMQRDLSERL